MTKALLTVQDVKNFILEAVTLHNEIKYLDRKQLAEYLKIHPYYVTKYLKMGMPWTGTKTRKRFKVTTVMQWLRDNNIELNYEEQLSD